jgi:hypothetical protein
LEPVEGEEKVMSFKYMATKVRFFTYTNLWCAF